jgi:quercetin dioxygenase-like cupin family protein
MNNTLATIITGAVLALAPAAFAETIAPHRIATPQDIVWGPPPSGLPAGAESAALFGDPKQEGMFALRLRAPKGYRIAPHTHPKAEMLTLISGRVNLAMGPQAEGAAAQTLGPGAFAVLPAGAPHSVLVEEDAVIQLNATGPWGIDYVDPKDDPRLNVAPAGGAPAPMR